MRGLQVDMVKSRAQISSLEDENKSLLDRVPVKSKKNLAPKCVKLDEDLRESNGLSNRLPHSNAKFDRMISMGKSKCDKQDLGYPNEHTNTSYKTVFLKGITNSSAPHGCI
ncbi:unnamed protein product, partial [Ilex paraguariensis]